jgi:hypothetical protein
MSGEALTWEYRAVDALDLALDLDALGRKGWELVAAAPAGEERILYFKRAAATFRERVTLDQKRRVYGQFGLAVPDVEGPQA